MNLSLSRPIRRLLAVALLLVLVLGVWSLVIAPLREYVAGTETDITRLQAALARGAASDQELAPLQAEVAALKQHHDDIGGFIQGTNESIAAAQLQTRVVAAAEAAGGELQSVQTLPLRDDGRYRRITVQAEMTTTLPIVQRIVYALEATTPYLFFDKLEINSRLSTLDAAHAGQNPTLDLRFEVSGYMRRKT